MSPDPELLRAEFLGITVRHEESVRDREAAALLLARFGTAYDLNRGTLEWQVPLGTYPELERIAEFCQKSIAEILQLADDQQAQKANPEEKEDRWEKIITAQNEQITSLLEEIKNLYGIVKKVISGGGGGRNDSAPMED